MHAHAYITFITDAQVREEFEVDNFLTLFDLIGVLARRRYQAAERAFSTLGLNHTEARLLTLLHQQDGTATQEALSNLIFVDRSNAGRALKSLEQAGYLERRKDEADKRFNLVQLTEKGREVVIEISRLKQTMAQSFFGALTEDEAGEVVNHLRKAVTDEHHT
jgi:MarR family transcriptional regulator, transcriptional regulator for hemolysin